jgi:hypothetical protein
MNGSERRMFTASDMHRVDATAFQQLTRAAEEQQHAQRQAEQHGEQQRTAKHQQGVAGGQPDFVPVDIGEETDQGFH